MCDILTQPSHNGALHDDSFGGAGFGRMDAYHAIDEYSQLSEMVQGSQIIARIIATLNDIL